MVKAVPGALLFFVDLAALVCVGGWRRDVALTALLIGIPVAQDKQNDEIK